MDPRAVGACADDAVAPGKVEIDPVGRVCGKKCRRGAGEKPAHVCRRRRVPDEEDVVAEQVPLAGLDRNRRRLREGPDIVGIGKAGPEFVKAVRPSQVVEQAGEGLALRFEGSEQLVEPGRVEGRHRPDGIEGGDDQAFLILGKVDVRDRDRRLTAAQGFFDAGVAIDEITRANVDGCSGDPADGI